MHRDIKLDNVMLHNQNQEVKIIDFGFSKKLEDCKDLTSTCLGTPTMQAPQVTELKDYGIEADLYSVGCVIYQLLFGRVPFDGKGKMEILIQKQDDKLNFEGIEISYQMKTLLTDMLAYDTEKRIT